MDGNTTPEVMAKEVSALNTFWLIQYLTDRHPSLDLQGMLDRLAKMFPCYVENLQSGVVEPVRLYHLQNPRYWFSHNFVKAFHDLILEQVPDPRLGYKIGSTLHKTQPVIRTTLGMALLGVHRVAMKISQEAAKYNRTKEYQIRKLEKGFVEIRIVHNPGIVINEFTMQWNAGCFAAYAKLAGANDITVDAICVDSGPTHSDEDKRSIWDFQIRYQEPNLLIRLGKGALYCLPWIRKLTEEAEAVEMEHQEQIINRDNIIRERTERLISIQERLIEEERASIGKKLQAISMELVTTEERERRAIATDLHDSVTQLLALSLSRIKSVQRRKPEMGELHDIRTHLEQALTDLRSLTFQISPPVLYDFGLEAALEWLVTDINIRHDMCLVFSNLLSRPLAPDQQAKVTLYRVVRELVINVVKHARTRDGQIILREDGDLFVAEVADEGKGFDIAQVSGNGFGLFSLKDRLLYLGGDLTIDTQPGEGTVVQIIIPLSNLSSCGDVKLCPEVSLQQHPQLKVSSC